jgi:hypothetical protein
MRGSKFKTNNGTSLLETGDDFFQPRDFGLEWFTEHFSDKINRQDAKAQIKQFLAHPELGAVRLCG